MARVTKTVSERRQEIIDTARELFTEYGFDKTQISDISKSMNVAQGLVYRYFNSKTDMLYAVIDELAEEKQMAVEEAMNNVEGSAIDRLHRLLNIKMDPTGFGNLITSIAGDAAIVEYCANKITNSLMSALITLIKQGNSDGSWDCDHPEETASFILRGFSGSFSIGGDSKISSEKKQVLTDLILRVLGLPSSHVS